mgnify:FL=1|tara:strand:- start:1244 stop:1477 length:234 start_codon:yes stop_codon:yes gene_type:complete
MLKIDLHGLTHKEAVLKVENSLILNQLCKYGQLELITGKSKQLQLKIIEEVLGVHNFSYYIPAHNVGVIIVEDNELL